MLTKENGIIPALRIGIKGLYQTIRNFRCPDRYTALWYMAQTLAVILLALISSMIMDRWGRDILILLLRVIGGIGIFLIAIELLRIVLSLDEAIQTIAYKVGLFFLFFAILKFSSTGLDNFIWHDGFSGAFVNNLPIYWLFWFIRRRRVRLHRDLNSEDRARLSSKIIDVVDDMKQTRSRVKNEIGAL